MHPPVRSQQPGTRPRLWRGNGEKEERKMTAVEHGERRGCEMRREREEPTGGTAGGPRVLQAQQPHLPLG